MSSYAKYLMLVLEYQVLEQFLFGVPFCWRKMVANKTLTVYINSTMTHGNIGSVVRSLCYQSDSGLNIE